MRLSGRVALITGGGSGIGEAICRRFAEEGATVIVADIDSDGAERVAADIREQYGEALPLRVDVSSATEAQNAVEKAAARFGRLDILVNNAGIVADSRLTEMTPEMWARVIAVDLKGVIYMTRAAVPIMMRQGYGKIVNISSRALLGNFGQTNYSAAKAGIIGFTRSAAIELGRYGIWVNAIAPGYIDTPMTRAADPRIAERAVAAAPLGRGGTPKDVANVALFLASDEAAFITGQCLFVCGGRSIRGALEIWS